MSSGNKKQYVYLDFDGAETFYKGELLNIEQIFVAPSGFSEEKIAQIVAALNEKYNGEVIFTAQKPVSEEYSTVFVGQTDAFAEYGDFAGMAETIDRGNQNKSDNAFVMVDAAAAVESVVDVISHEIGHIVYGTEHTEQTNTLADFAAAVLNQSVNMTIGGIDPDEYEDNWDDLPGAAKVEPIYGSTVNDVITFAADKSRMIRGNIELGSGNDKIVLQASKQNWDDDAETSFTNIFMGSGNDIIEGQVGTELDGVKIDMGSGDDTITLNGADLDVKIVDMGEGDNTIIVKNDSHFETALLKFGSGNDTLKIEGPYAEVDMDVALKNDGDYYYGEVSFGGGDDTLSISAGGYFSAIHTIDFGDGDDTLELNGGMNFDYFWAWGNEKETSISISGLEKIVAGDSAWISIYKDDEAEDWSLEQETLNRFIDAGVAVYNSFGSDKFSGPDAELADNTRAGADEYDDTCFWLCGESLAADTEYGFADTVDWIKLNKYGETVIAFQYFESENDVIAKLYDANGKYLETLNSERNVKNDITDRADGVYYLKLTVADNGFTCGDVLYDTEDIPPVDLSVRNLKVGSATIASNSSVKLTFTVTNNGNFTSGSSKIKIYDGTKLIKTVSVSALRAQTSKTFTETVKGSELGIGKRTLYVELRGDNPLWESNASNNKVSGTVTVKKAADLVVKDFKLSSSTIASNASVKLTFKIANNGEWTAGASKVKICDGTKVLKTLSVSALGAQKSQSFSVTLKGSELAGVGKRTLYVEADAEKKISEYSESNNKASKALTVKKIADLVVRDFKLSSSAIASTSSVKLTFKIANDGEYTAGASQVKIYNGTKVLKTLSVKSLGAKKSQSFSVTFNGSQLGLGKKTLAVTADVAKKVTEYSESNNKASGTVTVKKAADLVVKDFKLSSSAIASNASVKLTFKIANNGEWTAGASQVKIYNGTKVLKTLSVSTLGAKKSQSFSVTFNGSQLGLGKKTLAVTADVAKKVTEYNESNNKASGTVTVKKAADLVVKDFKLSSSTIASNASVKLTFKIANNGEWTAGASKVKICDGTKVLKTLSVSALGAQKSQSFSVTLKGSELAGVGKRTLYVEADAEKKISESNKSNNKASKALTVKKIADLVVKDFKLSSSTIASNSSVKLTFKIANDGEYTAGASQVKIYNGTKVLKTLSVSALGAKKSQSFSVTFNGSQLGLGKKTLAVTADVAKKVTEYSESNNKASKALTVKKIADLVVKNCSVDAVSVSERDSVTLKFAVSNIGEYTAGASQVKIYDGTRLLKTLAVKSLDRNASQNFTVVFSGSELGIGSRQLCVEVDSSKKVSEYSESNNKAYCNVTVTEAAPELEWLFAGSGDYGEADGYEDMLVSANGISLTADLDLQDEHIAGLAAALGEAWTFKGVEDWNNDGDFEVLFCGSATSELPQIGEDKKLLITLA